jgi:fructokinase
MGYHVKVEGTTGAGDAFIGGFLYQMLNKNANQHNLVDIVEEHHKDILAFANASGALTTTGKGAISSIPSKEDIFLLIGWNQTFYRWFLHIFDYRATERKESSLNLYN